MLWEYVRVPTYYCSASAGLLDDDKKAMIAAAITGIHHDVTSAAGFFAQVIFQELPRGNHFMGGAPYSADHVFVHGYIRAGRSAVDVRTLVTRIVAALSEVTTLRTRFVWVYVTEIPASQMAEYGHVLPAPGDEAQWLAGLPPDDLAYMKSIGH
jgi:phenylpyruvate tautomerase PptA (4-oxalocrotonate tautomerase family)